MSVFTPMGKMFIAMSILLILIGIILTAGTKTPWIGRLAGDIIIKKRISVFTFLLPPVIILSVLLPFYSIYSDDNQ
jgi:hypothetical protein